MIFDVDIALVNFQCFCGVSVESDVQTLAALFVRRDSQVAPVPEWMASSLAIGLVCFRFSQTNLDY